MKTKVFSLFIILFSVNSFAQQDCAVVATSAIKSVAALNSGLASESAEIGKIAVAHDGTSSSGDPIYCSIFQDDQYCARLRVIGEKCVVKTVESTSVGL